MANEQKIRKLVINGTEIFDIGDTTATITDVTEGKYFYTETGARSPGQDFDLSAPGTLTVTENNTTYNGDIVDGEQVVYSSVVVDIDPIKLVVTEDREYIAPVKSGGYSPVSVNLKRDVKTITQNNVEYDASSDGVVGYTKVVANIDTTPDPEVYITINEAITALNRLNALIGDGEI